MDQQVWLRFEGSLEDGFEVYAEIRGLANTPSIEAEGYLPQNPDLARCLADWQQSYFQLPGATRLTLDAVPIELSNPREVFEDKRELLVRIFQSWLSEISFRLIERQLMLALKGDTAIQIFIRTRDRRLHYLPWHLWDLVDETYKQSEIIFSRPSLLTDRPSKQPGGKIKMLAILGDSRGIDLNQDRKFLEGALNTEITFLSEPSRQECNDQLWDRDWDVLFFAGHSRTEDGHGRIYINPHDSLTLEELKYGLRRAIARGLRLAIFNSCDGLGLASELESLMLPQSIVMRYPVPDRVAHAFLKNFLAATTSGESFYRATRIARERLQGLEQEFPCASWLPVLYQAPGAEPLLFHPQSSASNSQSSLVSRLVALIFRDRSENRNRAALNDDLRKSKSGARINQKCAPIRENPTGILSHDMGTQPKSIQDISQPSNSEFGGQNPIFPLVPVNSAEIEIFISYSHKDSELMGELMRHLSTLSKKSIIRNWHDREITAGSEWRGKIHEHLNSAQVILLLISSDFLASDYCYDVELKHAIERHEQNQARVIPVILRPVHWQDERFSKLQALPTNAIPITSWNNRDEAFLDVVNGIRRAVGQIKDPRETPAEDQLQGIYFRLLCGPSGKDLRLLLEEINEILLLNSTAEARRLKDDIQTAIKRNGKL